MLITAQAIRTKMPSKVYRNKKSRAQFMTNIQTI